MKISDIINDDILSHDLGSIRDEVYAHRSALNPISNYLYGFIWKNDKATYDDYFERNLKILPR